MIPMAELLARYAQPGRLEGIFLRPARKAELVAVSTVMVAEAGLDGDHARPGKRAVSLIQAEHLPVIAALAGHPSVAPELLRRNLVVSGLNLTAMRGRALGIGEATLEITGPCAPCSRMEVALGHGGYGAMRGHGGWCAKVVSPGRITCGDVVRPVE
ncbi:MAG: MOSC domain-containing protein [Pseudomonadota bacterium]